MYGFAYKNKSYVSINFFIKGMVMMHVKFRRKLKMHLNSSIIFSSLVFVSPPCLIHPGETSVSSSIVVMIFLVWPINSDSFTEFLKVFIIAAECHVVPQVSLINSTSLVYKSIFKENKTLFKFWT